VQAHNIAVSGLGGSLIGSVGRWLDRGINRLMGAEAVTT